jgi:hypothetical protein
MALQNPEDWEFSLTHLLDDSIRFSQLSISRRRLQDEEEPSERHVQALLNSDPWQLSLTSLISLQLDVRFLVIVLEVEAILIEGH